MGRRLDAAAVRSAQTVLTVARTPFVTRLRHRGAVVRQMVGIVVETVEAQAAQRSVETTQQAVAATTEPFAAPEPAAPPHILIPRPEAFEVRLGDDEPCTCRGTGDEWCGATKADVVYDLMEHGMKLSREQADAIWADAQQARRSA